MAAERVERLEANALTPDVVALLLASAGTGATPETVTEPYLQGGTLLCVRRDDEVVGVLGLAASGGPATVVRALAVNPAHRNAGVARALLHAARKHSQLSVVAETDADAVGFYRACGFAVSDLGERYPGVRRFRCVAPPTAGQGPSSHRSR